MGDEHLMLDHETAYQTSIPPAAEERITHRHPDGTRQRAEYWLDGEQVGLRTFHPTGELEDEYSFRHGVKHGMQYRCDLPGQLGSAEPYENGVPHGTAYQWSYYDGRLIGTYTLEHGTGIDLWRQDWSDGTVTLTEVHSMRNGCSHGWEWWVNHDQRSVHEERHWMDGELHGIERQWNMQGRLRRGYSRYWVHGKRVTRRQYLRAAASDPTLPPFRPEDNNPERAFPPEIAEHLTLE
jgi:hypothetical protein